MHIMRTKATNTIGKLEQILAIIDKCIRKIYSIIKTATLYNTSILCTYTVGLAMAFQIYHETYVVGEFSMVIIIVTTVYHA